jgi:hypothetical protein
MDLVYYASGFFAALLGMRSMQWIPVALVPTLAFYVFGRYILPRRRERQAKRRLQRQLIAEGPHAPLISSERAKV